MFAKSFIALDGNGRLTGARTAQAALMIDIPAISVTECCNTVQNAPLNARGLNIPTKGLPTMVSTIVLMSVLKRMRHISLNVCNASSPMPRQWSLKPTGTAHNVLPITMVSVTA
ncbi:hypothetical protein OD28_2144 [Enterobacter asburiae]|nr:hypothetical protein OD28_2144 [Enterobacter asburiae]